MASRRKASDQRAETARLIKMKARKLRNCTEFKNEDVEDIEQELHLKVLEIQAKYDAGRASLLTFLDIALNNHLRNMIESRRAEKRGGSPRSGARSGDRSRDDTSTCSAADDQSTDPDELAGSTTPIRIELGIDIRAALRRLSPELREIALQRGADESVAEIAKAKGASRNTINSKVIEVRRVFSELGLDEYLGTKRRKTPLSAGQFPRKSCSEQ